MSRAARGRTGQLRLGGRGLGGGDALHRDPAHAPRRGDARRRHRQGDRRLDAELRRLAPGADGPAREVPEPPRERLRGHRRRHGDEDRAAQPRRGLRRRDRSPGRPESRARPARRGDARARLSDGRHHSRPAGHRGRVQDGPRHPAGARASGDREDEEGRPRVDRRHGAPVPGQQGAPHRADRGSRQRQEDRRHLGDPRRVRPRRHADGRGREARRHRTGRPEPAPRGDPAAVLVRDQRARDRGRAAARPAAQGSPPALPRPPPPGRRAPHALRPQEGRGARAPPPRSRDRAREPGPGHRDHPKEQRPRGSPRASHARRSRSRRPRWRSSSAP